MIKLNEFLAEHSIKVDYGPNISVETIFKKKRTVIPTNDIDLSLTCCKNER